MSDEEKKAIESVLIIKDISNTQLADVLTDNGYSLSEASVRRHQKHKDNNVNSK